MTALLRRFRKDDRGVVAILTALLLPVVVGMVALAVEVGSWYAVKREMQSAADAAALGAAFELSRNNAAGMAAAANLDAARNGFSPANNVVVTVNNPPLSGPRIGNANAVEAILSQPQTLLFADLFLQSGVSVTARGVALRAPLGDYCVLALDSVVAGAIDLNGTADISLTNCGVATNSGDPDSITLSGNSSLQTQFLETVGGYSLNGGASLSSVTAPVTNSSIIPDPYADQEIPSHAGCEYSNTKVKNTETLSPGVYCGGLTFNAGANATLASGTYIIDGDSVLINGGATVTGDDVTIILTGSGSDYATIDIRGGAVVDLSAPSSGDLAGMVVFQDPNAPSGGVNKFNGGSTMSLTGAVYFPAQTASFSGGNSSNPGCTRLVARIVDITGNAAMGNDCSGVGVPMNSIRPSLVE